MATSEASRKRSDPAKDIENSPSSSPVATVFDFFPNKRAKRDSFCDRIDKMTDEERQSLFQKQNERVEELMKEYVPEVRDERGELLRDLDSGQYTLFLERERNPACKCRADNCIAGGSVGSIYRLNLQRNKSRPYWENPGLLNRRFFHVTCFEKIVIDLERYVELATKYSPRGPFYKEQSFDYHHHHPAIVDWVENKGHSFKLEDYDTNDSLKAAFKTFDTAIHLRLTEHARNCRTECFCGFHDKDYPVSREHISGEPTKRRLSDVLLDTLGVNDLIKDFTEEDQKILLEVFGYVVRCREKIPEEYFKYVARYGKKKMEPFADGNALLKKEHESGQGSDISADLNNSLDDSEKSRTVDK